MSSGLPTKAKIGVPGKSVNVNTATYFLGVRMERAGMLRRGQALMLAVMLPNKTLKKGKRK